MTSGGVFAFVGRQRELGLLLAAVRHPPSTVLVEGEAGIGKSRLIREAAAVFAAEGGRVLTGFCHPLREPFPFGPVVDALRDAGRWLPPVARLAPSMGAVARLLSDLGGLLPAPPERAADANAERFQLVQGLRSFLGVIGPAMLVVEDAHWIDEATREMLMLLTRDMPADLSLVITYRTENLPSEAAPLGAAYRRPGTSGVSIRLDPLPEEAVHELARDALGLEATAELGSVLFQRSEGLPLVAEEDLITLREHRRGDVAAGGDDPALKLEHAGVPQGLRDAVTERLTALSPPAVAVVEAAAVLDVPAAESLLVQVAGLDPEQGSHGLVEALRAAVLRETGPGRYFFRHALAQQVAYQHLPGPVRSRLHRRALTVLQAQSPPPLVQIAHHTLRLGDHHAWPARAEAAADQAIALGDVGTAATLLRQILDQTDLPGGLRSRAALALAGIAVNGVDYVTNAAALRRILADPKLPTVDRGDIRLTLGLLMLNHAADHAGNLEIARAAEELADRPDRAARAMMALALNEKDGASDQAWVWMERAELVAGRSPASPTCAVKSLAPS